MNGWRVLSTKKYLRDVFLQHNRHKYTVHGIYIYIHTYLYIYTLRIKTNACPSYKLVIPHYWFRTKNMFNFLALFFHKKFVSVKVLDLCLVLQAQVRFRELASVEMEIGTDFERSVYIVYTSDLPPRPACQLPPGWPYIFRLRNPYKPSLVTGILGWGWIQCIHVECGRWVKDNKPIYMHFCGFLHPIVATTSSTTTTSSKIIWPNFSITILKKLFRTTRPTRLISVSFLSSCSSSRLIIRNPPGNF